MIDGKRFEKLEDKVEKVREDVAELKTDLKTHIIESRLNMESVREHIAGDKKIINTIEPLLKELPDLVDIIKDYQFEKIKKQKRFEFLKTTKMKIAFVLSLISLASVIFSYFR